MTDRMILTPLLVIAALFALAAMGYAYNGGTMMGCPEQFYHPENGCQVAPEIKYVPSEIKPIDMAAVTGCPEQFYHPENGCQVTPEIKYVEEYRLVSDEALQEQLYRGCPKTYFDSEQGCQLFK